MKTTRMLAFVLLIAAAGGAHAVLFDAAFPWDDGTGHLDGLLGTGISNENFVLDVYQTDDGNVSSPTYYDFITVGVKAHERYHGDLSNVDDVYFAAPGDGEFPLGTVAPGVTTWGVDWAVEIDWTAPGYEIQLSDLTFVWTLDFDPASGNTNLPTLSFCPDGALWPSYASQYSGQDYWAMSESIGFDYWTTLTEQQWNDAGYTWSNHENILDVNPWAAGEYEMGFAVYFYDQELASAAMVVQVVPEPASVIALLSLGAGGLAARRLRARRRRG